MLKIAFATWIANAAAGLTGIYGDVTSQADVADCSRQTIYDHAQKVQAADIREWILGQGVAARHAIHRGLLGY